MLQDLGNNWREKYGADVLAKKAISLAQKMNFKRVVIEGFRNRAEVETLRKINGFKLIGIVVNRKIRFDRLRKLKRREKLTWDLFNKLDNRDLGIGEGKKGLQVAICLALSDIFIENNQGTDELKFKLKKAVKEEING
jgi:hypothetical protein